ncbi:MAG TPA: DUF4350 domain-containing protein [Caldithrix abyssi]|uniref:DUF4350 domain-containing protein n=1 Tax=Caldithrix abyssi TaxID=187145 RepID=A0A7V5RNB0_CALAY|nr:DUF4350 domain-containing protein [Caldithrix abyssi]
MKKYNTIIGLASPALAAAALIAYSITRVWAWWNTLLLVVGLLGLAWFIVDYYKSREKQISGRSVKQGANFAFQALIVVLLTAMLAFISTRRHFRLDLTKGQLYSLSSQTVNVLKGLDRDVTLKLFVKKGEESGISDLLDEYSYRSPRLSYEVIDPDEQVDVARRYGVTQYGMLFVEAGDRRESVTKISESNLTNAIIKVSSDRQKSVYFLTGHGERSVEDKGPEGYATAAGALKKENYTVRNFNLVRSRRVPDSATVVVIASPKSDFAPGEADSLKAYVQRGGRLLILLDPESPDSPRELAASFKADVGRDMVVDASGFGQLFGAGPGMPLVQSYDKQHPITKDFSVMTFFPLASSVTPAAEKDGWTVTELLKTSAQSWADTDFSGGKVSFDAGRDREGPISLAVISSKKTGDHTSVAAVFGDSDFAGNGYFNQQGNGDLFLNTVNYLADEGELISIRPKKLEDSRLTMTPGDVTTLFYLVVIAIPLIMIALGVGFYLKRNRD